MHDTNLLENQPIAWTPTPEIIESAQLTKFMKQVGVSTWNELYQFSIRDVEKFTEEVLKFLDIKFDPPYEKLFDTSNGIEFPRWFSWSGDTPVPTDDASSSEQVFAGGTGDGDKIVPAPSAGLNITEMCLDRWQTDEMRRQSAVIWEGEDGGVRTLDYEFLAVNVDACAELLANSGIGKGDAVGIHLPMMPETVVALLAINRIGAIAVPVFSGYGVDAISSRLNAVGAKAVFTCTEAVRRGKPFDMLSIASEAVANVSTIESVVITERWASDIEQKSYAENLDSHVHFVEKPKQYGERFVEKNVLVWNTSKSVMMFLAEDSRTEPTFAEDPLIILYTSGTTGKPKGIAHTHASFPIKAAQDMAFGTDVGRGTRICWYTDIGWMMGPWLIYGALINGATICIYDGAPDYPTPDRMWEFCAKHKVEVLGISPTLVRSLAAHERSGDTLVPIAGSSGENLFGRRSDVRGDRSVPAPERKGWYRSLKLPHFDGEVTQFITFRLADSLPQGVLDRLKLQLEHDKLSNDSEEYRQRVDDYLDQGAGECILRRPEIAWIVAETILYEHERSCVVKAWVVMPNHAHLLLRMHEGKDLGGLMKRIKGVSTRRINQRLRREGPVWQADYFDRYIRDAEHFEKTIRYIENNPVEAGLVKSAEDWKFGSAWSGDTPVPTDDASASGTLAASSSIDGNTIVSAWSGDTPVPTDVASASGTLAASSSIDGNTIVSARSGDTPVPTDDASASEQVFAGGTGDGDRSVPAPFERHDLSSLRIFASTGEPWNPAPWWWLFEKVGNSKLPIINYSGGTEIAGGILMGNPLLPIKPCSFPAPCPGMDVDILNENGEPVKPGEVGELVIKQPWVGMARGFWQEKERYLETYWRRFKNIWVHGDWAMRDSDGHWFILGRSDDTLKVAGKRVGPAEVESLLVAHPLVTEAAVIGVPDETKGTAMVAFIVRSGDTPVPTDVASASEQVFAGGTGDEDKSVLTPLESELKSLVARDMGKPLAPSKIHFVSALPKTRNAKVMRRVIRAAYLGEDPGDLSALENPNAVDEINGTGQIAFLENEASKASKELFDKHLASVPDVEPIHPDDVIHN